VFAPQLIAGLLLVVPGHSRGLGAASGVDLQQAVAL